MGRPVGWRLLSVHNHISFHSFFAVIGDAPTLANAVSEDMAVLSEPSAVPSEGEEKPRNVMTYSASFP
jgi:hypothetical protein